MTLKQAFTMWAMAPRNTVLAARSRDAVQKVLMKKWNDVELEQITETFARRIFSQLWVLRKSRGNFFADFRWRRKTCWKTASRSSKRKISI